MVDFCNHDHLRKIWTIRVRKYGTQTENIEHQIENMERRREKIWNIGDRKYGTSKTENMELIQDRKYGTSETENMEHPRQKI